MSKTLRDQSFSPLIQFASNLKLQLDAGEPPTREQIVALAEKRGVCEQWKINADPERWSVYEINRLAEASRDLNSLWRQLEESQGIKTLASIVVGTELNHPEAPARRCVLKDSDREQIVSLHIREQTSKGVPIARITRDKIAESTHISAGMVSKTNAFRALQARKNQDRAPEISRSAATADNVDEAIQRGDWETVRTVQEAEQGHRPKTRR